MICRATRNVVGTVKQDPPSENADRAVVMTRKVLVRLLQVRRQSGGSDVDKQQGSVSEEVAHGIIDSTDGEGSEFGLRGADMCRPG